MTKRQLVFEDGTRFIGEAFGSDVVKYGEVTFCSNMTGYQELITDPANYAQIIVSTYPIIGSYGINRDDSESISPVINGLIVKEVNHDPSNFRSEQSIDAYLKEHGIPGITGVDTRKIVKLIQKTGTQKAAIAGTDLSKEAIISRLNNQKVEVNAVETVSITKPYIIPGHTKRIVIVDMGLKQSLLEEFTRRFCHITVVPYNYSASQIVKFKPDAVIFSHGPGNPEAYGSVGEVMKQLTEEIPLLCLGLSHQIFAQAYDVSIVKRAYQHITSTFPVLDVETEVSKFTTQNSHYEVGHSDVCQTELFVTHKGLNDGSIQGLKLRNKPVISYQFNPEGSPGTSEASIIFDEFINLINDAKKVE